MDILPKLLYLFQTIPITLPMAFFHTLCSLVIKFQWHPCLSRLKHKLLCYPKSEGGTSLPDFEIYQALSCRVLNWFPRPLTKSTVTKE